MAFKLSEMYRRMARISPKKSSDLAAQLLGVDTAHRQHKPSWPCLHR